MTPVEPREEGGDWSTNESWGFVLLKKKVLAGGQVGVSTWRYGEPEVEQGKSLVQQRETGSDDGRPGWCEPRGRLVRTRGAPALQQCMEGETKGGAVG